MRTDDEDAVDLFINAFQGATFGAKGHTAERLKAERRAGLTSAQRDRRGPIKRQMNFRATDATRDQLLRLAEQFDTTITEIIGLAVDRFAAAHGLQPEEPPQ